MTDAPQCPPRAPLASRVDAARWAELTAALWAEREAAEDVVYRLTVERLILQKAQRWLPRADDELGRAATRLRDRDADRAQLVTELVAELSTELVTAGTLAELLEVAPEPWPAVLGDHRVALRVLVRDLTGCAQMARRQLRISGRAVTESLQEVRAEAPVGAGLHLALGQFRAVERELLVTAADAAHRAAAVTVTEVLDLVTALDLFLS